MKVYQRDASFWPRSKANGRGYTVYHATIGTKNRLGGITALCDRRIMLNDTDGGIEIVEVPKGLLCKRAACVRYYATHVTMIGCDTRSALQKKLGIVVKPFFVRELIARIKLQFRNQATPARVLEAGSGTHYIPKWSEVAVTLSIVAAGFAIFRAIAGNFPVFEAPSPEHAVSEIAEKEYDPVAV
jgi:hypothetical protein